MARQTEASKKTATRKKPTAAHKAADEAITKHQMAQDAAPEERHRMITEMAYLIAEQRGFQGNLEMDDWLQAEADVDARFAARH